jgi:hypothetical protein
LGVDRRLEEAMIYPMSGKPVPSGRSLFPKCCGVCGKPLDTAPIEVTLEDGSVWHFCRLACFEDFTQGEP